MAKSPNAFRTISEAADEVGAQQHVLRFWETKLDFIVPVKRAGGRRFYRPEDITVLKAVRRLLHDEGLTIRGVQRLHKEQGWPVWPPMAIRPRRWRSTPTWSVNPSLRSPPRRSRPHVWALFWPTWSRRRRVWTLFCSAEANLLFKERFRVCGLRNRPL